MSRLPVQRDLRDLGEFERFEWLRHTTVAADNFIIALVFALVNVFVVDLWVRIFFGVLVFICVFFGVKRSMEAMMVRL